MGVRAARHLVVGMLFLGVPVLLLAPFLRPAGNQTISAGVTVTASSTAPAGGIATLSPGDVGIESPPGVLFVERFEDATPTELFARWTSIRNGSAMVFSADVPPGSPGSRSLTIPWVGGVSDGGHLYKLLSPGTETLHVRYYIKYPTSGRYSHTRIWMGGYSPPLAWPNPQAGVKPAGYDRFLASPEQKPLTARLDHYNHWVGMHQSADGKYWGNLLLNDRHV